jgi:hypothetical protein
LKAYHKALVEAVVAAVVAKVNPLDLVAVSVFTTQSVTAVLEKIRDQIKANTPTPADFLLGPGSTQTVFALSNVSSMALSLQTGTAPAFTSVPAGFLSLLLSTLRAIPGVVGTIAYGKYVSPNYEATGEFIPPIGTLTGEPSVQNENEIYFTLVLPSGTPPPNGWPVAIFGHGGEVSKDLRLFLFAAELAERRIATIGINAVGHGNGPLGTLTVNQTVGGSVTFLAGGRGIDQDGNGAIGSDEGLRAAPPRGLVNNRDGFQQTAVDLIQLVRVIEVGMDVDGDTVPDLDPSRIYYFGQSLGGMYGTLFLAVEPNVHAGVLNVAGGSFIETLRLSPSSRPAVGAALHAYIPALDNLPSTPGPVFNFNENMPLRDQPPVINTVAGALDIQRVFEWLEWAMQAGNPVAYASHLRKAPLTGVQPKAIIVQFVKGDKTVPNPTATALIRAGELADRATYYRNDLAFADPVRNPTGVEVPKNPHAFLSINSIFPLNPNSPFFFPALGDVGAGARRQIAEFFALDGVNVIDPDGAGPLFEVPIVGPLPEELNFIP